MSVIATATVSVDDASSMNPVIADVLLRSRNTILDILDSRGYDVNKYRHIASEQILTLAEGNAHPRALDIIVPKKPDSKAPCERAVVVYQIQERLRTKLGTFPQRLYEETPDAMGHNAVFPSDDVIIVLNEPYHEAFDKVSLSLWQMRKARVVFFHIKQLVVHPGRHELVDSHRKLDADEIAVVLKRFRTVTKTQFPLIRHSDLQSRVLGLVPGDLVEIDRATPTAGIIKFYRICTA